MIKALVEIINPDYVLLLSEEDSFEVVLLRDWLPEDIDPGDQVKLHFKTTDDAYKLLAQEMKRAEGRGVKTLPKGRPYEECNYMSFKKYRKAVRRISPHLTRMDSIDLQLAMLDSLNSDYGLLLTGKTFFKMVVPRNWLPEQPKIGDSVNVIIQLEGYWARVHVRKKLSNQRDKANLAQRKEGLKLVYDRERDNG